MKSARRPVLLAAALLFAMASGVARAQTIQVLYLRHEVARPPVLSNIDPVPADLGLAGAGVALADVQTTGKFLGQGWNLDILSVAPDGDFAAVARDALATHRLVILDAPAADQIQVADLPEAAGALFLNVSSGEARLRDGDCRANLLHTLPEDAARTDALMQALLARQWSDLVLVRGPRPDDQALAEAMTRSAAKFGLTIRAQKDWTFDSDLRESTAEEIPRFTQDLPDHQVLLVADAADDFARYLPDQTWLPRPVAGSAGMMPVAWSPVMEAWGAVQLQNRFKAHAGRPMLARDWAAWAALRALGEAATRTGSADPATLRAYMLGPEFELDGFKGRGLSFRDWNGQLRQPIPVVNSGALIAMAPLPAFLHQVNDMDSLGLDRPESTCTAFSE